MRRRGENRPPVRPASPQEPAAAAAAAAAAAQMEPEISGEITTRYSAERQIVFLGPVVLSAGGTPTAQKARESAQDAGGRNEARLSHKAFRIIDADFFTFSAVWIEREDTKSNKKFGPR